MDNLGNILAFILKKLAFLLFLVFLYLGYLHIAYKDNQPILSFERECREVHANKKFYKSYCTCLTQGILTLDLNKADSREGNSMAMALIISYMIRKNDDNESKKLAFDVWEEQALKQNQCSFEVSYIEYFKESLIK